MFAPSSMLFYLQVRIILLVPARNSLMETKVIDGSQVASIDLIIMKFIMFMAEQPFGRPPPP